MDGCIFCRVIAGTEQASVVSRGDGVLAFMDVNQPNEYKVLLVPERHVESIYDLRDDEAGSIMREAVRVAGAIRAVSGCDGLNAFQNNGAAAGQVVFHYHTHLLPRFEDDGYDFSQRRVAPRARLEELAGELRNRLALRRPAR